MTLVQERTRQLVQEICDGEYKVDKLPNAAYGLRGERQTAYFSHARENLNTVDSMINSNKNNYGLTDRELDVLALMVEGLSNPQIAEKLFITRATAKAHVHSILQKLCASTRTQATVVAMKEGLV